MESLCVILLLLYCTTLCRSETFQVLGPAAPLVAVAGEDLVLPCYIKTNISAEDMTVEWFRLHLSDTLVHRYKDHADRNDEQIQSYRGRTALFHEELKKGNASLKLTRVRLSDEGIYKCLIQSKIGYDDASVQVSIEAVGTHPVISMEGYKEGGLSLRCESKHWSPEPEVLWLNSEGEILPAEPTETRRDTEGFYVKRRVIVQESNGNRFYCRVMQMAHIKEVEIHILDELFHCAHSWKVAVATVVSLAAVSTVILSLSTFCYRKKLKELERMIKDTELKRIQQYAVDVTLDPDTANPELILSEDMKQVTCGDTRQKLPDNPERFDPCPGVLGKEGFSSGRLYYEVQVSGKTKWDLGVARESIKRKGQITASTENGYWTVWLRNGNEYKAGAGPPVLLSLREKPQKVGVFVDYEEGLVSFYDVEAKSLIYSFTGLSFTEKLYPYFRPGHNHGGKNSAPLIICSVYQTKCINTRRNLIY